MKAISLQASVYRGLGGVDLPDQHVYAVSKEKTDEPAQAILFFNQGVLGRFNRAQVSRGKERGEKGVV